MYQSKGATTKVQLVNKLNEAMWEALGTQNSKKEVVAKGRECCAKVKECQESAAPFVRQNA